MATKASIHWANKLLSLCGNPKRVVRPISREHRQTLEREPDVIVVDPGEAGMMVVLDQIRQIPEYAQAEAAANALMEVSGHTFVDAVNILGDLREAGWELRAVDVTERVQ